MTALLGALAARLAQAGLVAFAVATLCFSSLQVLPGDLAMRVAASRYGEDRVSATMVDNLRHEAGLDRPVLVQYAAWLGAVATGNFGKSMVTGRPVVAEIAPRFRVTVLVGGLGVLAAFLLAVPAGIAAGRCPGGRTDRIVAMVAALLASTPSFVLGGALVALVAVRLRWLPVAGDATTRHLLLPVASLGCALAPGLARVVRHAVAEACAAFPTQFARMLGVARWRVALRIAGRAALVPVAAYLPILLMSVLEGFVAIELLFNLDGIGLLLVRSLLARDIPLVTGIGIALAALLAACTLAADFALHLLDPRLRR